MMRFLSFSGCIIVLLLILVLTLSIMAAAQSSRKQYIPGRRAFVIDDRLSVVRIKPDLKSGLVQRLRRGRAVGILGSVKTKDGLSFYRIATSRNRRGWIPAEAVARPGSATDGIRLLRLIDNATDDYSRASLLRLCVDQFSRTAVAPKCLLVLGKTAENVSEKLTRDAVRRLGRNEAGATSDRRSLILNYSGLDRFNRIGVRFDYDALADRLVYDGSAYRELIRKYPKSDESKEAAIRLKR